MAINNPLIPGDPYSYDLKWLVAKVKEILAQLGTLDEAIEAKIFEGFLEHSIVQFKTVAEMLAADITDGSIVLTLGYHEAGDQGGLFYLVKDFNPSQCALDYFLTLDNNKQIAIPVIVTPYVTPEMFGAKGDGVNDDTEYFNIALAYDLPLKAVKEYFITTLSITKQCKMEVEKIVSQGEAVHVDANYCDLTFHKIYAEIAIVMAASGGGSNNKIRGEYWEVSNIGIKIDVGGGRVSVHNEFNVIRIRATSSSSFANYGIYIATASTSYANANLFNIRALQFFNQAIHLQQSGTYTLNNNVFSDIDPEGSSTAIFMSGNCNDNEFRNIRTEEFTTTNTFMKIVGAPALNKCSISAAIPARVFDLSELTGPSFSGGSYSLAVKGVLVTPTGGVLYDDFKIGMGNISPYFAPQHRLKDKTMGISADTTIDIDEPTATNLASTTIFRGNGRTLTLNESYGYQRIDRIKVWVNANQTPLKVIDAAGHVLLNIAAAATAQSMYTITWGDRQYAFVEGNDGSVTQIFMN